MPKARTKDNAGKTIAGSLNVFADLGFPNADEMLVKAELLRRVNHLIEQRALTQVQAARLLGVAQPNISALTRGRLSEFSLERLIRFLVALGQEVHISVRTSRSRGSLKVA
jgi:predicted XRE-type DNA-binding protein